MVELAGILVPTSSAELAGLLGRTSLVVLLPPGHSLRIVTVLALAFRLGAGFLAVKNIMARKVTIMAQSAILVLAIFAVSAPRPPNILAVLICKFAVNFTTAVISVAASGHTFVTKETRIFEVYIS